MRTLSFCVITFGILGAIALAQVSVVLPSPQVQKQMEDYVGCPATGIFTNGKPATGRIAALSLMKNRIAKPLRFDPGITFERMVAPGKDETRWDKRRQIPVRVKGYVAFVMQNFEGESCNCYKQDDRHTDTHIDLVTDPKYVSDFSKHVIVEITPRMKFLARQKGLNWGSGSIARQFLYHWVYVEGWLMWDGEHQIQAQNTHPYDPTHMNWRATCWEVHPVTNIELAE